MTTLMPWSLILLLSSANVIREPELVQVSVKLCMYSFHNNSLKLSFFTADPAKISLLKFLKCSSINQMVAGLLGLGMEFSPFFSFKYNLCKVL